MKTLILTAIRCSLIFLVTASLFSVQPAQAYIVTLEQVGSNVVANGCGPINLTGLTQPGGSHQGDAYIKADEGAIVTGPNGASFDEYRGAITGPHGFVSGSSVKKASSGSGDSVGIIFLPDGELVVPRAYGSGNALSSSATWNNATFATLGVTPGTYVWTWGTGAYQKFTLIIGGHVLPSWWYCKSRIWKVGIFVALLVGSALLLLAAWRHKLAR